MMQVIVLHKEKRNWLDGTMILPGHFARVRWSISVFERNLAFRINSEPGCWKLWPVGCFSGIFEEILGAFEHRADELFGRGKLRQAERCSYAQAPVPTDRLFATGRQRRSPRG
jgi:hypothetical protein